MLLDLDLGPRGLLTILFRQKRAIAVAGAVVLLLGLAYLVSMPRMYESRGSMLVKFGQDARPTVSVAGNPRTTEVSSSDRDEIVQSYISIIYSQDLLRQVVEAFGADKLYPGISKMAEATGESGAAVAVRTLQRGDLVAHSGSRNNVIDLVIRNKDPEVAASFARQLVEGFIRRQADIFNQPQTGFLRQQVEEAAAKLAQSQQQFQEFKQQAGVADLEAEMEQLMRQKTELSTVAYESVTRAQATLAELEGKEAEMLATYRPNSPAVIRLQQSIAAAREEIRRRQGDLDSSTEGGEGTLAVRISAIDARITQLEAARPTYRDLEQRVKIDEESYKYYQQRGEEARANDILNQQSITRISVIDTPAVPTQPASRQRKLLLLAVVMAAVLASLSCALLLEILDDRVRNPAQLASGLRLPVLATFSKRPS